MHGHSHHHGHGHGHSHDTHAHGHDGHSHGEDPHDHHAHAAPHNLGAFRISTLLNIALVVIEAGFGFAVGSMALLADAGHNFTDVLGLLLAYGAAKLSTRRPTSRHTYGMARSTILAALLNAALLLLACGALLWESATRIRAPAPVPGMTVMLVAGAGFLVNAGSAALFWRGRKHDINVRGAFLHMVADAAVSLGVIVVGGVVALTGWYWLDPLAGLLIALVILLSGWGLLRESVELSLDAVPRGMDLASIEHELRQLRGVNAVHDLHVWALSTTVAALTAHVEHDGSRPGDELLADAQRAIAERFGIHHTTIQLENVGCAQRC